MFSLNPVPSHSLPHIDISSSIDHIDDPEEYFLAYEQLLKAEKELKKLRGEVDPLHHHQGTTVRKRRPGLLGRTASYKHHPSADVAGPCNLFHSKPVEEPAASQAKKTKSKLRESTENEGCVVEKDEQVGSLFKECMSSFKYVEGDEGVKILREILKIKPTNAAACLPFHLPSPSIQLSHHSAFNNRVIDGKLNNSSPSTKSLLREASTLQMPSLEALLKDLYSSSPCDPSPCCSGGSSLIDGSLSPVIGGNHDDSGLFFNDDASKLGSEDGICLPVVEEADKSIHHGSVSEERLSKLPNTVIRRETKSEPSVVGSEKGNISDEFVGSLQEGKDVLLDPVKTDVPDAELKGCNSQPQLHGEDENCNSHAGDRGEDLLGGFDGGLQLEGDILQIDQPDAGVAKYSITKQAYTGVEVLTSSCANQTTTGSLENPLRKMGGNNSISVTDIEIVFSVLDDMLQSEVNDTVHEKVSDAKTSKDNSCPPEVTGLIGRHLENLHSLPEEYNEEHQIVLHQIDSSEPPPNEGNIQKAPSPPGRYKDKSLKGRTCLAGGSTILEDGRRKSSRRKFRPLEHWRGERLIYGRIHNSLPTVIGVKYASPGKNNLKFESFTSEECAQLAALPAGLLTVK